MIFISNLYFDASLKDTQLNKNLLRNAGNEQEKIEHRLENNEPQTPAMSKDV
jgi:hypothetical protein